MYVSSTDVILMLVRSTLSFFRMHMRFKISTSLNKKIIKLLNKICFIYVNQLPVFRNIFKHDFLNVLSSVSIIWVYLLQ